MAAHLFSMQRDARYFSPIPDDFWPDRWLSQESYTLPSGEIIPPSNVVNTKGVFLPFSIGSQNCVGKSVAMMEMRAILCAIVQQFDVKSGKGFRLNSYEESIKDVYITHRGPLFGNLTPR